MRNQTVMSSPLSAGNRGQYFPPNSPNTEARSRKLKSGEVGRIVQVPTALQWSSQPSHSNRSD